MALSQEVINALTAEKPEEVIKTLQDKLHGTVYHVIYQAGFDTAIAREADKVRDAQQKLTQAEQKATELATQVADLQRKAPDAAVLRTEFETKEANLKAQHSSELKKVRDTLDTERRGRFTEKMRQWMLDQGLTEGGVILADALLEKEEVRERISFKDDGTPEVYGAGTKVPMAPGKDQKLEALYGAELLTRIPKDHIKSKGTGGSGQSGGGAGGGTASPVTDVLTANEQRANRPNPLAPKTPAVPATK